MTLQCDICSEIRFVMFITFSKQQRRLLENTHSKNNLSLFYFFPAFYILAYKLNVLSSV